MNKRILSLTVILAMLVCFFASACNNEPDWAARDTDVVWDVENDHLNQILNEGDWEWGTVNNGGYDYELSMGKKSLYYNSELGLFVHNGKGLELDEKTKNEVNGILEGVFKDSTDADTPVGIPEVSVAVASGEQVVEPESHLVSAHYSRREGNIKHVTNADGAGYMIVGTYSPEQRDAIPRLFLSGKITADFSDGARLDTLMRVRIVNGEVQTKQVTLEELYALGAGEYCVCFRVEVETEKGSALYDELILLVIEEKTE